MSLLLKTFFDIIRLRKGPEHVPDSYFILLFAIGLFVVAMLFTELLITPGSSDSLALSVLVSISGYGLYYLVMLATGFSHRFVPTVSCIMACGSILTVLMVTVFVGLSAIVDDDTPGVIAWLILMWSVPVKGHIIARAINQHWFIGIGIAMMVFVLQRVAYQSLTAPATT